MLEAGWFETEPGFYLKLGAWIAGLFLTALYLTVVQKRAVAGAVATGMFWQQLAFIGHDLGHSSVSHKKRVDTVISLIIGNPLGGIAIGWWKWTHNVHHVVPNSVEHDPDNQHLPIFAVDHLMLDGFFSEFHNRDMPFCKVAANLVVWQPWTYHLVMVFARFNLYVQSWLYVLGEHCKRDKAAGLLVEEGIIRKGLFARLTREDVIVSATTIASLRRFKDDVDEVRAGLECGVVLEDTNDIKPGDQLEVFEVELRERTL